MLSSGSYSLIVWHGIGSERACVAGNRPVAQGKKNEYVNGGWSSLDKRVDKVSLGVCVRITSTISIYENQARQIHFHLRVELARF